jgi:secretory phospholipase A2
MLLLQFLLFAVFLSFSIGAAQNQTAIDALWNLQEMAECRLGYTALAYNDYGCWCGVGGSGEPVDGIDK